MPAPTPFASAFPALYLYPLNDSFAPKHITLLHNQRVKIGRQTNAKTTPNDRNGYFDSKVLSRAHAEVWEEGSKIFIKDVKSSNGTFINGERLSAEGLESEPFELKSDDIVEFGIDIVGEDNKTIVHHKVAARVVCIMSEHDAQVAARNEQHQMQQQMQYASSSPNMPSAASMMAHGGPSNMQPNNLSPTSSFNFGANQQRRPQMPHQNLAGMGGMGGSMRPPGKSGLTFDHVLSRLQGELSKSRETNADLQSVTATMHEIHETLGGGLPAAPPSFPHTLPPVRPPQADGQPNYQHDGPMVNGNSPTSPSNHMLLSELQSQLQETQNSLAAHVDKIRSLETALKEQETIRHEVRLLRDMMDAVRRGDIGRPQENERRQGSRFDEDRRYQDSYEPEEEDLTDDDAMSVSTEMPHELERVDEEEEDRTSADQDTQEVDEHVSNAEDSREAQQTLDEDELAEDEERSRRRQELGRPHTPEPTGLGMRSLNDDVFESRSRSKTLSASRSPSSQAAPLAVVDDLTTRLTTLSSQLESALELSTTLQAQHTAAQSTISSLESKVESLETLVKATLSSQQAPPAPAARSAVDERETLTSMINEWKKTVEGQWSNVQEEWNQQRERLNRAREEWEQKTNSVDTGIARLERMQKAATASQVAAILNGDSHVSGLVTPPSPRSLSADSQRPRRRRSASSRGRSNTRSQSPSASSSSPSEVDSKEGAVKGLSSGKISNRGEGMLATPAWSVNSDHIGSHPEPLSTFPQKKAEEGAAQDTPLSPSGPGIHDQWKPSHPHSVNSQAAVGILVLGVAAAAVLWRVKPE